MDTYEGLVIPFDYGEVKGETCRCRQMAFCRLTGEECGDLPCRVCMYDYERPSNLDAFRRWETGQPDRTKEGGQ